MGWFKSARAQSNTQPSWLQNRLFPVDETGDGVPLGPAVVPLALLTLTLAAWGLQAANAWRLIRWQAVAQSSGTSSLSSLPIMLAVGIS